MPIFHRGWYISNNWHRDISSVCGASPVQLTQPINIYYTSWLLKNIYRELKVERTRSVFTHLVSKYLPLLCCVVFSSITVCQAPCYIIIFAQALLHSVMKMWFLSSLCVSVQLFLLLLLTSSLLCRMMDAALLIMSSLLHLIHREVFSQLHLLFFSFLLSPSTFSFPFSVAPSSSPLASVWWWMSLHQLLLSVGSGACDARGPRGRRAKPNLPNEVLIKLIMGN